MIRGLLIAALAVLPVHSWYPQSCCGGLDCFPVLCDQLVEDKDGWLYIPTNSHFTAFQVQPSQDSKCHVCLGNFDHRPLCAFIQNGV